MDLVGMIRRNAVVSASLVLALASMLVVPPSMDTLELVDVDVILVLFTLMAAVAGMTACGLFSTLADGMVSRGRTARGVCLTLVMLPFLTSMLITNDVALITFVPLAAAVLSGAGRRDLLIPVLVLQTIAANLGSCLTPVGNPQNLFIFSHYSPGIAEFVTTMLPVTVVGAAAVVAGTLLACKGDVGSPERQSTGIRRRGMLCVMAVVFLVGVLSVAGFVPSWLCAPVALLAVLATDRGILRDIDYGLLLTFVFLFVFTGNLAQVPEVSSFLGGLMSSDPVLTSALSSQVISNVPAAMMLSQFTADWQGLLLGVSIGGLGTPVASMASLITIRIHSRMEGADTTGFMKWFLASNIALLTVLLLMQGMTSPS
ncbi:MAG: hypothetical protein IKD00_01815 [Candidatus Methanomethylophilaceae archaeon]|nr:hypothetical protein [Candidatus Methanomethylophilaceae archaeon]